MRGDTWSRRLIGVMATMLLVWGGCALVDVTTGFRPFYSYLAFGLVSLPVGAVLSVLSFVGLVRAAQEGRPRRYAVTALALSVAVAAAPCITLLTVCDDCIT